MSEIEKMFALPSINVNKDELLLIDWILIVPMPSTAPELEWHMKFKEMRQDIWALIKTIEKDDKNQELALTIEEAEILLALIPTTFRWGTGEDCGYSLKIKLIKFIKGESDADKDDSQNNPQDETRDDSTESTVA